MLITKENIIQVLGSEDTPINISYIFRSKNDKWWILNEEVKIKLIQNEDIITAPKGMIWDLSSVPKLLWGIFPPFGDFIPAPLVHDLLYHLQYGVDEMGWHEARKFADKEMLLWSNITNGGRKIENKLRYLGVRVGGKKAFQTQKPYEIVTKSKNGYKI